MKKPILIKKNLIAASLLILILFPNQERTIPFAVTTPPITSNTNSTLTPETPPPLHWLTGPLIASGGTITPYGQFTLQPYISFITFTGKYNKHWHEVPAKHNFFSINTQVFFYTGLSSWMDITIAPQFFYNTKANQNGVTFGDLPIQLDFQLLDPKKTNSLPGIKFSLKETFPTGPYQRLNPTKLLTDQGGFGTYATNFNLVIYKMYQVLKTHFFTTSYNASVTINTPVKVHGFNIYGGGYGTKGKILPGNIFEAIVSFEFTLTQNWVLAIDNVYTQVSKTKFFGDPGVTSSGATASIGLPAMQQISFAPAIEYNFSQNLGMIGGCWFSAWGRNSPIFRNAIFSLNYTF